MEYTLKLITTEFYKVEAKNEEDALSKTIKDIYSHTATLIIVKQEEEQCRI